MCPLPVCRFDALSCCSRPCRSPPSPSSSTSSSTSIIHLTARILCTCLSLSSFLSSFSVSSWPSYTTQDVSFCRWAPAATHSVVVLFSYVRRCSGTCLSVWGPFSLRIVSIWLFLESPYSPAGADVCSVVVDIPTIGQVSKSLLHVFGAATIFDPRTVQPVASSYTDWAIRPTKPICTFKQ
jgi:hypothetical protein